MTRFDGKERVLYTTAETRHSAALQFLHSFAFAFPYQIVVFMNLVSSLLCKLKEEESNKWSKTRGYEKLLEVEQSIQLH